MPEWAAGTIVGVVTIIGGAIFRTLLAIKEQLGSIVANTKSNADAIDDLQTWRLNVEQANAMRIYPARSRRDIY